MGDLLDLLSRGSFVVRTRAPLEAGPDVTVAASVFSRDGSVLQVVREPPAEQALSASYEEAVRRHRENVAGRLRGVSRKLAVLRNTSRILALLAAVAISYVTHVREAMNAAVNGGFDVAPVLVALAKPGFSIGGGVLVRVGLRAILRWYLKKRLSGGG